MNTIQLLPEVFKELADEFPLLRPSVRMVPFPSLLGLVENQEQKKGRKSPLFISEDSVLPRLPASVRRSSNILQKISKAPLHW